MPIIQDLIGRIPDPQAQAKAAAEMQTKLIDVLSASDSAQIQVDAAEAANPSVFVSGWRPFVGWLCAIGLGVQTIAYPTPASAPCSRASTPLPEREGVSKTQSIIERISSIACGPASEAATMRTPRMRPTKKQILCIPDLSHEMMHSTSLLRIAQSCLDQFEKARFKFGNCREAVILAGSDKLLDCFKRAVTNSDVEVILHCEGGEVGKSVTSRGVVEKRP